MKKYYIFVVAAVVAMAACTKVETSDTTPARKISFEVANYASQTKAAEDPGSVLAETNNFSTKAWLHANGAATGTDFFGTIANNYVETVTYNGSNAWEPSLEYFWPKGAGSYINFVSWFATNSKAPSTVSETVMNWGTSASPMTIVTDDNFLFADEAWRYTDNAETYKYDGVAKGVPTLFHHALAKLKFNLRLSTETESTKSIWDVEIQTVTMKVGNNGYLALVNTPLLNASDEPITGTQPWKVGTAYATGVAATSTNIGWTRPASGATLETIVEEGGTTGTAEFKKLQFLNFQPNATRATVENGKFLSGDFVEFLPFRTVLPQIIESGVVTLGLTFTIKVYHDNDSNYVKDGEAFSTELITIEDTTNLFTLVNTVADWKMNTKYIYNVTIDPVGRKVLFDPAVAEWNSVETDDVEIYHAD